MPDLQVQQLWVIDDAGLTVPSFDELVEDAVKTLSADEALGGDYLFHPDDDITQMVNVFELQLAKCYALAQVLAASFDPTQAIGVMLRDRGSLVAAEYVSRARSTIPGTLFGTPGTIIPALSLLRYVPTGDLWRTTAQFVIGGGGAVAGELESQEYGPIAAEVAPSSSWEIQTPVAGWTTPSGGFLSTAPAEPGKLEATDLEVREAILLAGRGGAGAATYDADVQNVAGVTGVSYVALFVNRTLIYDPVLDLAEKRGRFVVEGGKKQDILDAIAATESTGLNTEDTGAIVGTSTRFDGKEITTSFTRPTDVPILFRVTLSGDALPSQAECELVVFAAIDARMAQQDVAEKVVPAQYAAAIVTAFGENVVEECVVEVRLSALDPWQTTPLVLSAVDAERATVDTAPAPAEVLGAAEEPVNVTLGMTLNLIVQGVPQPVVFADNHTLIATIAAEIEAQAPMVDAIDADGRLLIRSLVVGVGSSIFINGGTAVAPLGLTPFVPFQGTDGDVEVILA